MKFNKISRKVLAYACATAMVFSSVSAYQVLQVSAYEESDYTTIGDDKTVTVGDWTLYAGKWGSNTGEMAYAGSTVDDLSLKVISSDGNSGCWKLQAKHTVTGLTKDTTYDLKLKVKASQAGTLACVFQSPPPASKNLKSAVTAFLVAVPLYFMLPTVNTCHGNDVVHLPFADE